MAQDFTTLILRNVAAGPSDRLVEFEVPAGVLATMAPGQFFMIGVPGADVLLRRPFSVCGLPGTFDDAPGGAVQVLYRVYGRATSHLATLEPGARLEVLGPLGKGFDLPEPAAPNALFVAGGIGSAPFPALARALEAEDRPAARMIYGARTKADLPLLDWFRSHCAEVVVTTEDGSAGQKGLVTDVLDDVVAGGSGAPHVYACGPNPMLKAVAHAARSGRWRCDLSLEAPMACGFGVCLGCVVPCRDEATGGIRFERVCVEGPVMRAERLAW